MGTNLWAAYLRAIAPRDAQRQVDIADATGQTQATISRWLNGKVSPDEAAVVVAVAKAYDRNVLEAFVAAGFIDEQTAGRGLPARSIRFLADLRLGVGQAEVDRLASRITAAMGEVEPSATPKGEIRRKA